MNKMEVAESIIQKKKKTITSGKNTIVITSPSVKEVWHSYGHIKNECVLQDVPFIKTVGTRLLKFIITDYPNQRFRESRQFQGCMLPHIQICLKEVRWYHKSWKQNKDRKKIIRYYKQSHNFWFPVKALHFFLRMFYIKQQNDNIDKDRQLISQMSATQASNFLFNPFMCQHCHTSLFTMLRYNKQYCHSMWSGSKVLVLHYQNGHSRDHMILPDSSTNLQWHNPHKKLNMTALHIFKIEII